MGEYNMLVVGIVIWNVVTFLLYGIDKRRARNGEWRISEATLLGIAFLLGGVGSWLGMKVFRHKTDHLKFKVGLPLAVIVNAVVIAAVLYFAGIIRV